MIQKDGNRQYQYRIKEESVPANYTVSYNQATGWTGLKDGTTKTFSATNKIQTGKLKIHKSSKNPSISDDNRCYTLAGATYEVYTDAACTKVAKHTPTGPLTTDTNGNTGEVTLVAGTYYVKELGAPSGFELNTKEMPSGTVVVNGTKTVETSDMPGNDPIRIRMTKIRKNGDNGVAPSLAGTEFTIKYYDDMTLTKAQAQTATPKRTWVIKTVERNGRYVADLIPENLVAGSSELYYDIAKGGEPTPTIPLGTITIQETKAAPGYKLDGNGYMQDINGNKVSTDTDFYLAHITDSNGLVSLNGGNEFTSANSDTDKYELNIKKFDSNGKDPLVGVKFTLTDENGNAVVDRNGKTITEKTTDSKGMIKFDNLRSGRYFLTETKTTEGHQLLKEPIETTVPMRMTQSEAQKNNLDVSNPDKVLWSDAENCYLILSQTFEVTNGSVFKMVPTGGTFDNRLFIPLAGGMVIFAGLAVVLLRKKKRFNQ